MTTTPAMPDLTAVIKWLENGCDPREAVKELKHYQSKLQALTTLKAQQSTQGEAQQVVTPAEVSDAETNRLACLAGFSPVLVATDNGAFGRFARAILALRPQAVPMTRASRDEIMAARTADGDADEWPEPWAYRRGWEDAEAHHRIGITAPAGGEG